MIDRTEIEAVASQFGTPDTQIIRDHLISHALAAIADWPDRDDVTFFGGTALCRTWLPDLRLSEDIDLLIDSDGDGLRTHIFRRLRREFPYLEWIRLGSQHQVETWTLAAGDLEVKVQLSPRPTTASIESAAHSIRSANDVTRIKRRRSIHSGARDENTGAVSDDRIVGQLAESSDPTGFKSICIGSDTWNPQAA